MNWSLAMWGSIAVISGSITWIACKTNPVKMINLSSMWSDINTSHASESSKIAMGFLGLMCVSPFLMAMNGIKMDCCFIVWHNLPLFFGKDNVSCMATHLN